MEKSEQQESFARHRLGKIAVLIDFDLIFPLCWKAAVGGMVGDGAIIVE